MFLRRRERAKSEFRRRNIFDLYIEEVAEACARLKGGRFPKEKLKQQLQRIALKRTGGTRTDEILGRNTGPEGLPHSIIVTAEGTQGEAPALPEEARGGARAPDAGAEEAPAAEAEAPARGKRRSGPSPTREALKRARGNGKVPHATLRVAAAGTPARGAKGTAGKPASTGARGRAR